MRPAPESAHCGRRISQRSPGTQPRALRGSVNDHSCEVRRPPARPRVALAPACRFDVLRERGHASASGVSRGAPSVALGPQDHTSPRFGSREHLPAHPDRAVGATRYAINRGRLTVKPCWMRPVRSCPYRLIETSPLDARAAGDPPGDLCSVPGRVWPSQMRSVDDPGTSGHLAPGGGAERPRSDPGELLISVVVWRASTTNMITSAVPCQL